MNFVLEIEQVSKHFQVPGGQGGRDARMVALQGLTFRVSEGEAVGLVGPSGCGKSTTLKLISGLDFPDEGRIRVYGKEIESPDSSIGFMLQKDLLMPWKTVVENAELGMTIRGWPRAACRQRALALLSKYGLGDFLNYRPHQLSGGMRQRVALARTMAIEPKILLLDEPFAALDFQTKLMLQQDLLQILKGSGITVVYITHDIGEALSLCNRVIVITSRPGRVKSEHVVRVPQDLGVIEKRNSTVFSEQFQAIWKDLDFDLRVGSDSAPK
jgi:NitT/TauT family transport system ATP-binding protein